VINGYEIIKFYNQQNIFCYNQLNAARLVMNGQEQLTIEQQFKLKVLKEQVKTLNLEQAQNYLVELLTQSMIKDNLLAQWMKGNN